MKNNLKFVVMRTRNGKQQYLAGADFEGQYYRTAWTDRLCDANRYTRACADMLHRTALENHLSVRVLTVMEALNYVR